MVERKDRWRRPWAGTDGFSLLEVLVALGIVAVGIPVLLALRNHDLDMIERARHETDATLLAQQKLVEAALSLPPASSRPGGMAPARRTGASRSEASASRGDETAGYRWTRTVRETRLPGLREVQVRVSWPRADSEGAVELTTYVFVEPAQQD